MEITLESAELVVHAVEIATLSLGVVSIITGFQPRASPILRYRIAFLTMLSAALMLVPAYLLVGATHPAWRTIVYGLEAIAMFALTIWLIYRINKRSPR